MWTNWLMGTLGESWDWQTHGGQTNPVSSASTLMERITGRCFSDPTLPAFKRLKKRYDRAELATHYILLYCEVRSKETGYRKKKKCRTDFNPLVFDKMETGCGLNRLNDWRSSACITREKFVLLEYWVMVIFVKYILIIKKKKSRQTGLFLHFYPLNFLLWFIKLIW